MSLFDSSGRQISGFRPGSEMEFGGGYSGFPTKPGPGRPSQMMPQYTLQPPMQVGQYPTKPGPGRPSQMMPQYTQRPPLQIGSPPPNRPSKTPLMRDGPPPNRPSKTPLQMGGPPRVGPGGGQQTDAQPSPQKARTAPFARYAQGTDMSQVPRTDTMQPNPMYKPGSASPVPSPSYGTPYGQPIMPGLMPEWAQSSPAGFRTGPAPADPRMQGFMDANPNMSVQEFIADRFAVSRQSPQADGNLAYATPDQRPQPFTQSMNFMGQPVDPAQFYGQRDAFIQNINQAKQPFAMNPAAGRPQMDFGGMWNQAGDMVQGGWQNPLAGMLR